jgi:hypothetical protein
MGIFEFLNKPDVTLIQALLLKFRPVNMDVLPLYIVLLIGFPPILWLMLRRPVLALAASGALYAVAWQFQLNLPLYPNGVWYFNPLAWQLLFVFGTWCALGGAERLRTLARHPVVVALAAVYIVFAFCLTLTWHIPRLAVFVPTWLADTIYPIDKINLDVLRFAHFLALAILVVRFVPIDAPWLKRSFCRPAILCGQHSLEIFCAGVFLSFAGHFVFIELSDRVPMQVLVSAAGIAIMVGIAALLSWYKGIEGRSSGRAQPQSADLAGGEA